MPQRRHADRLVKRARFRPGAGAGRRDPVPAFGDGLVTNGHLTVVAVHEPVALEPRHHLIESRGRSAYAVVGERCPHDTAGLLATVKDAKHEKLEMGEGGQLPRFGHNVALCTIGLDGSATAKVGGECGAVYTGSMRVTVCILLIGGLYVAAAAQAAKTTWDGVYTDAQAKRGEEKYTKSCAGCHGAELMGADTAPSLTGPEFNAGWNDLSADDLAERIRTTMPADAPGSLSRADIADVMAFIFAKDKFPAGTSELPSASEQLKQIKILSQKP